MKTTPSSRTPPFRRLHLIQPQPSYLPSISSMSPALESGPARVQPRVRPRPNPVFESSPRDLPRLPHTCPSSSPARSSAPSPSEPGVRLWIPCPSGNRWGPCRRRRGGPAGVTMTAAAADCRPFRTLMRSANRVRLAGRPDDEAPGCQRPRRGRRRFPVRSEPTRKGLGRSLG